MRVTNRTGSLCTLACLALLATGATASAGPITVGSGWQEFNWTGAPGAFNNGGGFTFSAPTPVTVMVTDTFVAGDIFEVYDNSALLGTTSFVNGFPAYQPDPDLTFGDPNFSYGTFFLGAGAHSLEFKTVYSPKGFTSGAAYFRVDGLQVSQVPEPASLALAVLGLGGLGLVRLRRLVRRGPAA